ncbi:MAG: CPBP family intramembrane metalloprotease [Oscillospiraceae bacterium]|nr:CPBP family intramembrane metalloprotease [Oscillospiraceae bacterium]
MKKLCDKPVLFGIAVLLAEPYLAAVFVMLTSGILSSILMLPADGARMLSSVCNIGFVLLLSIPMKKWIRKGYTFGIGRKRLINCCLLLLPFLAECLLYICNGALGSMISSGMDFGTVAGCFLYGLTPGLTEEIIFRGWILGNLLLRWKDKPNGIVGAVAVSSVLFSMAHFYNMLGGQSLIATLNQLAFTLAMGFSMGAAYCRSRNLLGSILFHSFHDFFGLLALQAVGGSAGGSSIGWFQLGLYALIIAYSLFLLRPEKHPEIRRLWEHPTAGTME